MRAATVAVARSFAPWLGGNAMDIARRFPNNPILKPADVKPSAKGLKVACLLNPGAFRYRGIYT